MPDTRHVRRALVEQRFDIAMSIEKLLLRRNMLRLLRRHRRREAPKVELAALLEPYGATNDEDDGDADDQ